MKEIPLLTKEGNRIEVTVHKGLGLSSYKVSLRPNTGYRIIWLDSRAMSLMAYIS